MRYIRPVEKLDIEVCDGKVGSVELWDFSRSNESFAARQEAVATVASLAHGKDTVNKPATLIDNLIKWGHYSPFEFVRYPTDGGYAGIRDSLRNAPDYVWPPAKTEKDKLKARDWHHSQIACFKITLPIFCFRQIVRHRGFSFMEISRRYTTGEPQFADIRRGISNTAPSLAHMQALQHQCAHLYQDYLSHHVPSEVARVILPTSLMTTVFIMGDVNTWANFLRLRLDAHAQEETRAFAEKILSLLEQYQPALANSVKLEIETMNNHSSDYSTKLSRAMFGVSNRRSKRANAVV